MTASMRSPERARRLFPSPDDAHDSASTPTPPGSNNNSTSSYAESVYCYSSAGGSSTKSNVSSSGQKRARRSSTSTAASTAKKAAAATSVMRDGDRPASPRVTKALFADGGSSDESSDDDCGSEVCSDIDDSCSEHGDNSGRTDTTGCNSKHEREQTLERIQQTQRPKPLSALTDAPTRRIRCDQLNASSSTPTPTRLRRRSLRAAAASATSSTATTAAVLPDVCSPAKPPAAAASRKTRVSRSRQIISPFIKGSDASVVSSAPVRTKAIARVSTSPLHSPTTGKLSKHMTSNLSMASPVQTIPKTPQKCLTGTPSRQKLLGRREVLATVLVADTQNALGSPFDDFEMLSWLGVGISAEVYKARSKRDGALFAVKKSKHELRSERERTMLMQEIEILQTLASSSCHFEHIVRYFQAWQDQGYLYLQMELCAGGTLKEYICALANEATAIAESEVWRIVSQVAAALDVLHRHDVVHLDVKPENIFVTEAGRLKLGDFGMATRVTSADADAHRRRAVDREGDSAYMAKELLTSSARLPSADMFCLGIMLLELVTGMTLPVSGDEWHALRSGSLPAIPFAYSTELTRLISDLMQPDAASRPSATAILALACVKTARHSAPCASLLTHVARQKTDTSRELLRLNRSASFVRKTPRKKRLSLSQSPPSTQAQL